ncbi:MAG TPA: VOC family protein [Methylomirabilota bacterium]|nr:VOC family protein [Methylomirabilota bacterium]
MRLIDAYPVIVTERLAECRNFYTQRLGFGILFEATWFVYLASAGEPARGVAFMTPDHPSQPPGPERFSGEGVFLTFQVLDAAAEQVRLHEAGVPIVYPLRDEPWGQRRFAVRDPAGTWLDIVQQIDPAPGFWDPYARPDA